MTGGERGQQGLTVLEVVVASAVLGVAVGVALTVYDVSRKTLARGQSAAEHQQAVRGAIHRFLADVRLAGVNHNPDGDAGRPDEPIEAAFDTALVIRGDFDGHDPAESATPEDLLAGPRFEVVSTGNDEIVAWFLAKPDGSSPDALTFEADVADTPRDGAVETVSISNVALVHDDPPYTLYRATLNADTDTFGGGGFVVRAPVADNVTSMRLAYYDGANDRINALDPTSASDDIGGDEANADQRARIRRIEIEITAGDRESPQPELVVGYAVRPRNLGFAGAPDRTP